VAVLRRGPSAWSHVGRWDVGSGRFESGSWLRGTIYPQRCDLSPDGRWLAYFALKTPAPWTPGPTYIAISRLPWVHALVAWGTGGTWTQGVHFVEDRDVWDPGTPDEGDAGPVRVRSGLRFTRADTFAVERRRGWTETADTPPREPDDMWDERRVDRLRMEKARPGSDGSERLIVGGWYAAFRGSYGDGPRSATSSTTRAPSARSRTCSGRTGTRAVGCSWRPETAACRSATSPRAGRPGWCPSTTSRRSSPIPHPHHRRHRAGRPRGASRASELRGLGPLGDPSGGLERLRRGILDPRLQRLVHPLKPRRVCSSIPANSGTRSPRNRSRWT